MAPIKKKPTAEPVAAGNNPAFMPRPDNWNDSNLAQFVARAREQNAGFYSKNWQGKSSFHQVPYDTQIYYSRNNKYASYILRNLRDFGEPELQKQNDAQEKQDKKRALQQPKRTSLTGAQGIVGSAMNLGSAGLLGG